MSMRATITGDKEFLRALGKMAKSVNNALGGAARGAGRMAIEEIQSNGISSKP